MGASSAEVRVLSNRSLGPGCFVLTFERPGISFRTGQYLSLGIPGQREQREYSIYSGENDPNLSVLVREVPEGLVSGRLARLAPGDKVHVDGPFGYFTPDAALKSGAPLLLLATGTGISPFHSYVHTHPDLNYTLLHGIRTYSETALEEDFSRDKLISCVSREDGAAYRGRLTARLRSWPVEPESHAFLCGNCDMIYEAFDVLRSFGLSSDRISTEVYF
jgi:ferredoxin--NADP+ reductase/benzoate/toluate 1,2-dioxygenase reductase subunit